MASDEDRTRLTDELHRLADLLAVRPGGELTAERLVQAANQALPHFASVSLTYVRADRRPRTLAASDPIGYDVDALQYDLGEGPCLEAIAEHDLIRSDTGELPGRAAPAQGGTH